MQLLPSLASTSLEEILGVPPSSIRAHCDLHQHNLSAQQQLRKEHCQRCLRRLLTHLQKQPQQEVSIQNKKQQQPQPARDWRNVHHFLLLHLGNMPPQANNNNDDDANTRQLLASSLQQIYLQVPPNRLLSGPELQVTFHLVLRHTLAIAETFLPTNNVPPTKHLQDESMITNLDLLQQLIQNHDPTITALEDLTVMLVRILSDNNGMPLMCLVFKKAQDLLQDLCNIPNQNMAYFAQQAQAAVQALQTITDESDTNLHHHFITPPAFCTTPHDTLMYWKCLAQSRRGARKLARCSTVLDRLVDLAVLTTSAKTNYTIPLCYMAVDCLSLIATNRREDGGYLITNTTTQESDPIMMALLCVLVRTQDPIVRRLTIPGFKTCDPKAVSWQQIPLLEKALSHLSQMVRTANNSDMHCTQMAAEHQQDVAAILLAILEQLWLEGGNNNSLCPLSFAKSMDYLDNLLQAEDDLKIQELAMNALNRQSKQHGHRIVLECPSILHHVGSIVCQPLATHDLQQQAVQVFRSVSSNADNDTLGILARQSKVLEALVLMASTPAAAASSSSSQGNVDTKELAVVVLLRLAQNVCNRRILVHQVGVLACMIRYARSLRDTRIQQERFGDNNGEKEVPNDRVCLKTLKQRISELAEAM